MQTDDIKIYGERIFLRKMNLDDVTNIVNWRNDPDIKKWMFNQEKLTIEGHLEWFRKQYDSNRIDYLICNKATNEGIGTVNFTNIENYQAEAGKMLGNKNYWGGGYAKEAFRLWLLHGFENLGFQKIFVRTMINNIPNIKLNEKLGFKIKEESTFTYVDTTFKILIMEIKKEDLL